MSEEPKDKDSKDPGAEGADKAAAPAPKPKLVLPVLLIGVVAGGLVAGVALGSLLVAPQVNKLRHTAAVAAAANPKHDKKDKKAGKDKKEKKKGEEGKAPVYKLDNIIVNPAGSQGQRFLMCTVAMESDDDKALETLRAHEVELRDRIITLLSKQSLERLTAESARDSLRAELLVAIKPALGPDGQDVELKVYLPQFVVQ